jgi:hypothetical protein
MFNKIFIYAALIIEFCNGASAVAYSPGCRWDGCPELLIIISGGSTKVILFEVIVFVLVSLYMITKIYDK